MKCKTTITSILVAFIGIFAHVIHAQYDAAIRLTTIATSPVKYGVSVPFNITVFNQSATLDFQNVDVIVYTKPGYTLTPAINSIWMPDPIIPNAYITTIPDTVVAGGNILITINLTPQPGFDTTLWDLATEIYGVDDLAGNDVTALDADSPHDKNNTNDAGGAIGFPSDNAIAGNGTGTPGSTPASTDEDDHDVAFTRIYDIALKKLMDPTPPDLMYGDTITFRTIVYNQGNEITGQVIIQELLTEGYIYDPTLNTAAALGTPSGWSGTPPKPNYTFNRLRPGDSIIIPVKLILSSTQFDSLAWNNYTEVFQIRDMSNVNMSTNEADSQPNSNSLYENQVLPGSPFDNQIFGNGPSVSEDEDDHDVAAPRIFDLAIKKDRTTAVPSYSYTQNVSYFITVYNQGNITANSYTVVDTLPCGFEFNPALNPGWTQVGNRVSFTSNVPLIGGTDRTHTLTFGVNPCYTNISQAWTNLVEISNAVPKDGLSANDIDAKFDNILSNDYLYNSLVKNDVIDEFGIIPGQDEDNHDMELTQVLDFALRKRLITPAPYTYGSTLTFRITVYNQGNVIGRNIKIKDYVPQGYTLLPSNFSNGWNAADTTYTFANDLRSGDSVSVDIFLQVKPGDSRKDWFNYAQIIFVRDTTNVDRFDDADSFILGVNAGEAAVEPGSPNDNNIFVNGPPNAGLDEDDHDPAGFEVFDLSLTKQIVTAPTPVTYGSTVTFSMIVHNDAGTAASSYTLVDYMPCGYSFSSASNPGWTQSGSTLSYTSNQMLSAQKSDTVLLNLTVQGCTTANAWVNVAEISQSIDSLGTGINDFDSTPDTNPSNDAVGEDDIDNAVLNVYDLSLDKIPPTVSTALAPGDVVTYTLAVTNEGNVAASNIVVTDYLSCGYTFTPASNPGWTQSGSNLTYTIANLAPGVTVNVPLRLTLVVCTQPNAYRNIAEISSSGPDADSTPDNNPNNDPPSEDDHDIETIILGVFDLAIDKSIVNVPSPLVFGAPIDFLVTVINQGTVPATNIKITDYLCLGYVFDQTINPNWIPVNGNIEYTVAGPIAAGQSVAIPLRLTLQPCSQPNGYRNVAEISSSPTDIDSSPDNNPSNDLPGEDDIDSVNINVFDLSLIKTVTNPQSSYTLGSNITFTFVVTNEGNVLATNFVITDYLPCGFTFNAAANPGWSLVGGNVQYTVSSLAPQFTQNIQLTLTIVRCQTAGAYTNRGEISSSNPDVDSTPDNNPNNDPETEDDSHGETINVPFIDLALDKVIANTPANYTYGSPITFNLVVTNQGNTTATNYTVVDYLKCGYTFTASSNPGWTQTGSNLFYNSTAALSPGTSATIPLILNLQYCNIAPRPYGNKAEISSSPPDADSTPDSNPNNDLPGEDDIDSTDLVVVDLALVKTVVNPQANYSVGQNVSYQIAVTNQGNVAMSNVKVVDHLPCGLTFGSGNVGWINIASYYEYTIPTLAVGQTVNVTLNAVVASCTNAGAYTNISEISSTGTVPGGGPGRDVDSTPDTNPGNDPESEDDHDGEVISVTSSIGNYVWFDLNANGIQEVTETPIPNVNVSLYTGAGVLVSSTTTNSAGIYGFSNLTPGQYYLIFTAPQFYFFTSANTGANDNLDSDVTGSNGAGSTDKFTLAPGVTDLTFDAGMVTCSKVSGIAWYDINKNDIMEQNENGINGLTVRIYRNVNGSFVQAGSTLTGYKPNTGSTDGYFEFCMPPGSYYVKVFMPPVGLVQAKPNVLGVIALGNPTEQTNDSDLTNANGPGTTPTFTVAVGQEINTIGAGYYPMATAGNLVWEDVNFNGVQDNTEPRVSNVLVEAFDGSGSKIGEDYTDNEGVYKIEYLQKASYYLRFTPPSGYGMTVANTTTEENDSDVDHSYGLNTTALYSMDPGVNYVNIDAGLAFGVLPVKYVEIKATHQKTYNLVEWSTASEINADKYLIQRYDDGEYITIGETKAAGNSSSMKQYRFEDKSLDDRTTYVYRIVQRDLDGQENKSEAVSCFVDKQVSDIKAYPNPARGKFTIELPQTDEHYTMQMINQLGQVVATQRFVGGSKNDFSLYNIAAGLYYLNVTYNGKTEVIKMLVE